METKIYGNNEIIGDVVTVTSGGTVAVSRGFNSTIGITGSMDEATGSANTQEIVNVPSPADAVELFGADSELSEQVRLAYANGVFDVFAYAANDGTQTETFDATQSGVLTAEIADPNVTSGTVSATDTTAGESVDVSITYVSPPSTPDPATDGSATANLNPVTREIEFSASGTYEVSYDSLAYQAATDQLAQKNIRFLSVCTENEAVLNDALATVNARATHFDFKRVVGGANPRANPEDYSDGLQDQRMVLVAPSRGYQGEAQTDETRTCGAVAGTLAARPLGDTATNTSVDGFVSVYDYPSADLATLDGAGLLTLSQDRQGIKILRDLTTSTDVQFERVYACEIVDDFAYTSHLVAEQFIGRLNTSENRLALENSLENVVYDARNTSPPLIDDGVVDVVNDGGPDEVTANIGLDVVDVMDRIFVDITVGPIMRFNNNEGEEALVGGAFSA